jgi:hypothetical protein
LGKQINRRTTAEFFTADIQQGQKQHESS